MLRTPFANLLALGLALAISGCALFSGAPRFVAVQDAPSAPGAYSQGTVFGITLRVLTLLSDQLGIPLRYLEEIPMLRRDSKK